jgi:hypothetical protein
VIAMDCMKIEKNITIRGLRQSPNLPGFWVATETDRGGYTVRCGDVTLNTVNGNKARIFKSLDSLKAVLQQEIGITEFKVESLSRKT